MAADRSNDNSTGQASRTVAQRLRRAWSEIADLLFPPRCEICGRDSRKALCEDCQRDISFVEPPYCQRCNTPFPPEQVDRKLCPDCRLSQSPLLSVRSVGLHCGPLRTAVVKLKFDGAVRLAGELAELIYARALQELDRDEGMPVEEIEALVPAVLHPRRRRWRGFDQAILITQRLAELWGIPMLLAVDRVRHTEPQVRLAPDQRRRNMVGAFKPRSDAEVKGLTVAIVDDVWTTGATLEACAAALSQAGAAQIYGLTVTRSVPAWHPAARDKYARDGA